MVRAFLYSMGVVASSAIGVSLWYFLGACIGLNTTAACCFGFAVACGMSSAYATALESY